MFPVIATVAVVSLAQAGTPIDQLSAFDREVQAAAVRALAEACDGCEADLIEVIHPTPMSLAMHCET